MRNALVLFIALILFVPAALPGSAQTADAEGPNRLMAQFASAWSRDDTRAVAMLFADDALFITADTVIVGRDAIDAHQSPMIAGTGVMEITPVQSGTIGDLAYQAGRWVLAHEGGPSTGAHLFVFRRGSDGQWRVVTAHVYNDSNAP